MTLGKFNLVDKTVSPNEMELSYCYKVERGSNSKVTDKTLMAQVEEIVPTIVESE